MQRKMTTGNWTEDKTARLSELWDEGIDRQSLASRSATAPRFGRPKPRAEPRRDHAPCHRPMPLAFRKAGNRQFPVLLSTGPHRQALLRSPLSHRLCAPRADSTGTRFPVGAGHNGLWRRPAET